MPNYLLGYLRLQCSIIWLIQRTHSFWQVIFRNKLVIMNQINIFWYVLVFTNKCLPNYIIDNVIQVLWSMANINQYIKVSLWLLSCQYVCYGSLIHLCYLLHILFTLFWIKTEPFYEHFITFMDFLQIQSSSLLLHILIFFAYAKSIPSL